MYAPTMVAENRFRMSKFVFGVSDRVIKEFQTTKLIKELELSRLIVYAQQIEEEKLKKKERE